MDTTPYTERTHNKNDIANMKVAMYFNMASMSPIIELHTAMLRDLLSRGNKVTVYVCDRSFKSPMENPFNREAMYAFKMFRVRDALRGLDVPLKIINLSKISGDVSAQTASDLETGVMSSFASMLKAQHKDELSAKWLRAYDNMCGSAKKLYNYFVDEIKKEQYKYIFMFNGRFGCARPALEAARDTGIGYGLCEIKASLNEIVFVNELVHSIAGNTRKAIGFYEADKKRAEERAAEFFKRKTQNKETGDPIYTKQQTQGALPEAIVDTTKKVIAIYPTTDDEYKFIGQEWDGIVPESQPDEIEKMAQALPREEYFLVVKMHPHQEHTAEDTIGQYVALAEKYPHVIVEKPLSKKDTYALMSRADVVVTFASTIGVEATYAGKPVVLIGDTRWGNLNIAHKVYTGEDAAKLIRDGIAPKPILGAIIWGNYFYAYRDGVPGFEIAGKGNYFVDGKRIGKSTFRRILQLPAKLEMAMNRPGFTFGTQFFLKIIDTMLNITRGKWAAK